MTTKAYSNTRFILQSSFLVLVFTLSINAGLFANTYYATKDGAGDNSGNNWNNAISDIQISSFINTLQPGDTLNIGSGIYNSSWTITTSGTPGNNIMILGEDTGEGFPLFQGTWVTDDGDSGDRFITLENASYITLKQLDVENWRIGIFTDDNYINKGIVIDDVDISQIFVGMYLQNFEDSKILNCEVVKYMRRGFRFQKGCRYLKLVSCLADQNIGDSAWPQDWPFGFMIEDGEGGEDQRDITFIRCESRNNQQPTGDDTYWNGDGFVIETDHPNIKFYNCVAYGNQDGGWDDKGLNTYYENCISIANGRNFRCWKQATYVNCLSAYSVVRGGSSGSNGMWASGNAELKNCTFHNNNSRAIDIDGGKVTANNCIFSADSAWTNTNITPNITSGENNIFYKPGTSVDAPNFKNENSNYTGYPKDAFNSIKYGPETGFFLKNQISLQK